jgi:hypothetical protein
VDRDRVVAHRRKHRLEVVVRGHRPVLDAGDDVSAVDARSLGGRPGERSPDRRATHHADGTHDGAEQQRERDQGDREVVGDARREHATARPPVGRLLALLVRFDERPRRDGGDEDQPHRLDVDVLDATEDAVAPLVDDQSDRESEQYLGGDRERQEVVDPRDDERVPGLAQRTPLCRRVLEHGDGREDEGDQRAGHDDQRHAQPEVAPRAPRPPGRGDPIEELPPPLRVEGHEWAEHPHRVREHPPDSEEGGDEPEPEEADEYPRQRVHRVVVGR